MNDIFEVKAKSNEDIWYMLRIVYSHKRCGFFLKYIFTYLSRRNTLNLEKRNWPQYLIREPSTEDNSLYLSSIRMICKKTLCTENTVLHISSLKARCVSLHLQPLNTSLQMTRCTDLGSNLQDKSYLIMFYQNISLVIMD